MTSFEFGDVVLIKFPQIGRETTKKRPALVVLDIGDADFVLAPITTKERSGLSECQIIVWQEAGLLQESWARLAKVACLSKNDVARRLGQLSDTDKNSIKKAWRQIYLI